MLLFLVLAVVLRSLLLVAVVVVELAKGSPRISNVHTHTQHL